MESSGQNLEGDDLIFLKPKILENILLKYIFVCTHLVK